MPADLFNWMSIGPRTQLIHTRSGIGYNLGMNENESVGSEQSTPVTAEAEVYEGLKSTGLSETDALRTAQAIRDLTGPDIKEALEVHQGKMATLFAGFETRLTAKIDGVDSKLDAVKIELKSDTAQLSTELKADAEKLHTELSSELKAMRKELNLYRWGFIVLIGLVTLLIAIMSFLAVSGLIPVVERWLWQDSTPAESLQAHVESAPPEAAVPPESHPSEPSPQ